MFLLGLCLRLKGVCASLCVVLFPSFRKLRTEERNFFPCERKDTRLLFFSQEVLIHRAARSPVVDNLSVNFNVCLLLLA